MDARKEAAAKARPGKDDAARGAVPAGDSGGVGDGPQQAQAAEPAAGPDGPKRPTVYGVDVDHLSVLLKQGEQAWLLGGDRGNHEYANIRYMAIKGKPAAYMVKEGGNRLGGVELLHVDVRDDGAWLTWTQGFRTRIPQDWYQVTWQA